MKTLALILAALTTGVLAGTAHATTATSAVREVRQHVVSYADLNLENEADVTTLLRRIKSAARLVCGLRNAGPMPIDYRFGGQSCADNAIARAVADVNVNARSIVVVAARG